MTERRNNRPGRGTIEPTGGGECRSSRPHDRRWRVGPALAAVAVLLVAPLLGGCQFALVDHPFVLLDPKGPIGADEKWIIILATGLMLIVVIPVIAMTLWFAWRYRASNTRAPFAPDWAHSSRIELVVWLVPCLIIAVLATVTWTSSHKLDPYRPIAAAAEPLQVDVVSLDWKWLFIYPAQHIASVNELAFPVDTPVRFHLTSASVMNSFFIPQLGSQIYTMAGMETKLSLLADAPGDYAGLSANYSGGGFSDMTFAARAMRPGDFAAWVAKVRSSPKALTPVAYRALQQPSERVPVTYYGDVGPGLFHDILNKCTDGGPCMDSAMTMSMAARHGNNAGLQRVADDQKAPQ